jgi:hypothetical protein
MTGDRLRQLAKAVRRRAEPLRYGMAALAASAVAHGRGTKPVRLLLVSDGEVMTSEEQFAPFVRFAGPLRRDMGLVTRFMPLEEARRARASFFTRFDVVGLKVSFRADQSATLALARRIRAAIDGTASRLFYFDGDDDLNVQRADLLALSDCYVKKHVYRDRQDYAVARIGKSNLTDHVARVHGWSFVDNEISSTPALDPALVERIVVGWNIGLDDKIADLAARLPTASTAPRPVDVCSRAVTTPDNWIYPLRHPVAATLEGMADRFRVLVPHGRVDQDEYYAEMQHSTICVSPFGYGELCWRDFEAILCGCLLVKPDMGHVETAPDVFVPGVTYAPVRWDYADLPEVCERYLADVDARQRIVAQARAVLMESLTAAWFVERLRGVLA